MAKIANQICRKIYITDDNPRNEDPKRIRNYLSKYIDKNKLFNIGNRSLAIKKAIKSADPQEIILIAGKGHEEEQIYKNKVIKISDKKILKKINLRNKTLNKLETLFFQNNNVINKILGKKKLKFNGISIDTRTIKKNNLFLGIKGKKFDGNNFVFDALKKGAGCVVSSSKIKKKKSKKILFVKDSIYFLNEFARLKRKLSSAKIVAVTGSAGKTSLKNLINELLLKFDKLILHPVLLTII